MKFIRDRIDNPFDAVFMVTAWYIGTLGFYYGMFGHNYEAESWLEWPMLLAVSLLISPMISFIPLFLFLGLFEMTWHGVSSVLGLKEESHEDRWQVVCVAIIAMGLFFQFYMEITHIFPNFFTMYPFSR